MANVDYAALAQQMGGTSLPTNTGNSFHSFQLGIAPSVQNPPTVTQKILSAGGGIVKSIAKPFEAAGVGAYNLGSAAYTGARDLVQGKGLETSSQEMNREQNAPRQIGNEQVKPIYPTVTGNLKNDLKSDAQSAGNVAQIASNFVGASGAADVAQNVGKASIGQLAKQGAIAGAKAGTIAGAGSGLADENTYSGSVAHGVGNVVKQTAEGTATGAVTGAALGTIAGGASAAKGALQDFQGKYDAAHPDIPKVGKTSIASDLTPDYHSSMVNEKVTTPDGKTNFRVNEGKGTKGRSVNQSKYEAEAIPEVEKIKDYSQAKTFLEKSQKVDTAISDKAEALKGGLRELDKSDPLNNEEAHNVIQKHVLDNLYGDAKDSILERGKGVDGAVERSSSVQGRYGQDVATELSKYDGTRAGILDLRKNLDAVYEDARGKNAFGSEHLNAIDDMHYKLRAALNKELDESSKDAGVSQSLKEQSLLYRAKRVLADKAKAEKDSGVSRYFAKHPFLHRIEHHLTRRAVTFPVSTVLAGVGYNKLTKAVRGATK